MNDQASTPIATVFDIDGEVFDLSTIPHANTIALLKSAIGHKVRNEASSRVLAKLNAEARATKRTTSGDAKAELDAGEKVKFNAEDEGHMAEYKAAQAAIAKTIREGVIGDREPGAPRLTEFDRRVRAMAAKAVLAVLRGPKFDLLNTPATKNKTPARETPLTFRDGTVRIFGEMCDSWYAKNKGSVDKAVQKALDDERRAAERSVAATEGEGGLDF